ncbi:hypothetical protein BI49514_00947 [Brevibacterium iodinum ATCC 49514]|uniref:Uncharacterized protein n=1 Tax=Brevibacterium iodinum ATCC 49514 TaxID=1255616 RepID=A0A2H1IHI3_9MICO|nr:hypothetical protein BI49514_00947 [Brevibacterium iodinum ATCC 49514]SUW12115.1 Uncharacterised protein [Brevibacterium iodinum]
MSSSPSQGRRPGLHPALSTRQGFALLEKAESVRNLLRDSVEAIRSLRVVSLHGDGVFTLGSIGVEKAMKVMLGCNEVEASGLWPSKKRLKDDWGHDIQTLSQLLDTAIERGLARTTHTGYAETLATRISESTALPLLFATFARYGKSGRFHHLDVLATNEPGSDDPPSEYWGRVEFHVRTTEPEFADIPYGDNQALDEYEARLRGYIADELEAWWFCVHRLGVQGCFGDLGKKIGWEIREPGRPEPPIVRS